MICSRRPADWWRPAAGRSGGGSRRRQEEEGGGRAGPSRMGAGGGGGAAAPAGGGARGRRRLSPLEPAVARGARGAAVNGRRAARAEAAPGQLRPAAGPRAERVDLAAGAVLSPGCLRAPAGRAAPPAAAGVREGTAPLSIAFRGHVNRTAAVPFAAPHRKVVPRWGIIAFGSGRCLPREAEAAHACKAEAFLRVTPKYACYASISRGFSHSAGYC